MQASNVVGDLDVAILCVIAFVLFFFGLVYYLRQEDKREGYPYEIGTPNGGVRFSEGFPPMPRPKIFYRPHGRPPVQAPRKDEPLEDVRKAPDGFPLDPGYDPLAEGIGPAAYPSVRADLPDLNVEGEIKIVPLSKWDEYYVAEGDPDPRGWPIESREGAVVGTIVDLWFNRAEFFLRYVEFSIEGEERTRMVPVFFCEVMPARQRVRASTLKESDLKRVPITGSKDQITMLEEDRLNAFFAGGITYSHPIGALRR